jgi:hypothetical protein
MASRIAKLPIVACSCLVAGIVIGLVLAPASAQPMSPVDGQVAVRSDHAVYLIANGQRRWIATVLITDDEINAYPEGEPIYSGLAPLPAGAPASSAAAPPTQPSPVAPLASPQAAPAAPAPSSPAPSGAAPAPPGSAPQGSASQAPVAYPTPNGATGEIDPLVPLEVDIDGEAIFEPGERIAVALKTKTGASCELTVRWPDGTETPQPPQAADVRGRCSYSMSVPSNAPNGLGQIKGSAREGGRASNQTVEFEVMKDAE